MPTRRSAASSSAAPSGCSPPAPTSARWRRPRPWRCTSTDESTPGTRSALVRTPLVAAVSGFCLGGGCELAMACDVVVASETAVFGQPETGLGLIPGAGGTQRLTRAVGKALAMDVILSGRRLSAREALDAGLVARVVAREAWLDEAKRVARDIAAKGPGRQPAREGSSRAGRRRPAVARHRLRAAAALPRLLVRGRARGHDGVRGEAAAAVRRPVVCAPHAPDPRRHRPFGDGRARRPLRRGHGGALRGGAPALPGRDPAGPGAAEREGGAHRVRPALRRRPRARRHLHGRGPRPGDRGHRRGRGRRRGRRGQRRDERAQGVPARKRPQPRVAQLRPHRHHRQHAPAHRAAAEEEEASSAGERHRRRPISTFSAVPRSSAR